MRKMLLILCILFTCISIHAQIAKGSLFLGGDISGGTQKTKHGETTINKQSSFQVSPVIGLAIRENVILGTNASFMAGESKNYPSEKYETRQYAIGVFLRKYMAIGASSFYIFLQGGVNALSEAHEYDNFTGMTYSSKRKSIAASAYPGISYALNKKLHLETGFMNLVNINYYSERREQDIPTVISKTNGFNIYSTLNNPASALFLGFRLLLSK